MVLLKAYQYFFYKLYRSIESTSVPKFWSDWKAIAVIILLEIWTVNSINIYYHYYTQTKINSTNRILEPYQIIVVLILVAINYYIFDYQAKWRTIIKHFDNLPKKQNRLGGIVVWGIVILIVIIYFSSLDLMSELKYE